ncbi:MAG: outer membrane beta-barrel protein [Candidatus Schekmanbacteria bacterium]|nr:outer membrane beta-barrel protein [Candidatus Schekmanbacteria bacterium]
MKRFYRIPLFVLLILQLITALAFAESKLINVQGGVFNPTEKAQGNGDIFLVGYDYIQKDGISYGFEVGYKKFNRDMTVDVLGGPDITGEVEVTSIPFFFNAKYHVLSNETIKPYIGGGVNISLNQIDTDELDKKVQQQGAVWLEKNDTGASWGVHGLAGIRFMVAQKISLFIEGRYSYEAQMLKGIENDKVMNFGGFYGTAGIGVEF